MLILYTGRWLNADQATAYYYYHQVPLGSSRSQISMGTDKTQTTQINLWTKCWWGQGTKATLIHCRWERKNGTATLEDRLFLKKLNILEPYDPAPCYLPKGDEHLLSHKNPHINVYSSFVHNCNKLEGTKVSFGRQMD